MNGPLVIVGDSFAVGIGASRRSETAYPARLSHSLDERVKVVAAGGTGFLNRGPKKFRLIQRGTHLDRARRVPRDRTLLLIQSSPNDRFFSPEEIRTAMDAFLARVGDHTPVAVIGPTWAGNREHLITNVEEASASFADAHGYPYIDMSPLRANRDRFVIADRTHLNDDGHAAFALLVAQGIGASRSH